VSGEHSLPDHIEGDPEMTADGYCSGRRRSRASATLKPRLRALIAERIQLLEGALKPR
jgi:hypothetical protein